MTAYVLLAIGLLITYLNNRVNLSIIYFNAFRNVSVRNYNEKQASNNGKGFSPLAGLMDTLKHQIWENWFMTGIYLAYVFNTYILSKGNATLLEILIIYLFIMFSIVYDYKDHLKFNKIYHKVMPPLTITVLIYMCAKINNVDLIGLFMK